MKKTANSKNIPARILCAILAALMLFALFMPSIKMPVPDDSLTEVYRQIIGKDLDNQDKVLCEVITESFSADDDEESPIQELSAQFAKLTEDDLHASGGHTYGFDEADRALEEIKEELDGFVDLDSVLTGDMDTDIAINEINWQMKNDEDFRDLLARYLYATVADALNKSDEKVNVKSTMRQVQGFASYLGRQELSPFDMNMIAFRITMLSQSGFFRILPNSGSSDLTPVTAGLSVGGIVFMALHALYAIMLICVLLGAIFGKRLLVKICGIIATVTRRSRVPTRWHTRSRLPAPA